jgi:hypothetical protein
MKRFAAVLVGILTACAQDPAPPPAPVAVPAAEPAPAPVSLDAVTHAPKLVCEKPVHDFGRAASTQIVTHAYDIRNDGDLTLDIKSVTASCGCTVASVSTQQIPPGGTAQINAALNLIGRQGRQVKAITIQSNDPQQPAFILTLQGDVADTIGATPDRFMFGVVRPESTLTQVVELVAVDEPGFRIITVESSAPQFTASSEIVEEGKRYRIRLVSNGPLPAGVYNGSVVVRTDHPAKPVVELPIFAQAANTAVMTIPQRVELDPKGGEPVSRAIVLFSPQGDTFIVESVQVPTGVVAQVEPWGAKAHRLQMDGIRPSQLKPGESIKVTITNELGRSDVFVPLHLTGAGT